MLSEFLVNQSVASISCDIRIERVCDSRYENMSGVEFFDVRLVGLPNLKDRDDNKRP